MGVATHDLDSRGPCSGSSWSLLLTLTPGAGGGVLEESSREWQLWTSQASLWWDLTGPWFRCPGGIPRRRGELCEAGDGGTVVSRGTASLYISVLQAIGA